MSQPSKPQEQPNSEGTAAPDIGYVAGLGRRLGAMMYDALLIIALWMFTLFLWVALGDGEAVDGPLVQICLCLEWIAFHLYSWARSGATLGMQAWRIKITRADGKPANLSALTLRLASAPLSLATCGLGYIWQLFSSRGSWHDMLSNTTVVHLPKTET
ncbi:MAG: RDD family protein [Pseudomonadota bacterium]